MMGIMSVRAQRKQESHHRIVQAAARAVREKGFDAVGVAEVMRQAGLTHGGFYAHFPSRDALLAEAVQHAGDEAEQLLLTLARGESDAPAGVAELVDTYLSTLHLSVPGFGCPLPALATDAARQPDAVRQALGRRAHKMTELLAAALHRTGVTGAAARDRAVAMVAAMVGAMTLARAADDSTRAEDILRCTREYLLAQV